VIGIVNGAIREKGYAGRVGEENAQRISTASALVLFTAYFAALERRWPLATPREAAEVGAAWCAATVAFEFLFGHYVAGDSWEDLVKAYDVRTGNLWIAVPAWMAVGPAWVRAAAQRRGSR
jgi:hypothetical protein